MEFRPVAICIQLLRSGFKFCAGCGKVAIEPGSPDWMRKCRQCYSMKVSAKFCQCGEEIQKERRLWALRKGTEPRWCFFCSKGVTKPCDTCGLTHPLHWKHDPVPVSAS